MHAVTGTGRLIAGRYRLQGPVGRGAMGIVWRGRDELLHRDVAVKQVQITALTLPAEAEVAYQRTLREARTAARLSHPAVVTVFDVVEEDGSPWIIMEFIGGRSLEQVIAEDGPLPPLHAAELGARLLSALETAHAAGVLHRDVKPSNVLISADGRAVLTDFGIATFAEDPGITLTGMVVGTPGFTAPERVRGDSATPASDLWSLGATLYAAVEGRGPFERPGGSMAVIAGVAAEEAPRAPSAGPLTPVIEALLSRDPAQRPDAAGTSALLTDAVAAATATRPAAADQGYNSLGYNSQGHDSRGRDSLSYSQRIMGPGSRALSRLGYLNPARSADPARSAGPATGADPAVDAPRRGGAASPSGGPAWDGAGGPALGAAGPGRGQGGSGADSTGAARLDSAGRAMAAGLDLGAARLDSAGWAVATGLGPVEPEPAPGPGAGGRPDPAGPAGPGQQRAGRRRRGADGPAGPGTAGPGAADCGRLGADSAGLGGAGLGAAGHKVAAGAGGLGAAGLGLAAGATGVDGAGLNVGARTGGRGAAAGAGGLGAAGLGAAAGAGGLGTAAGAAAFGAAAFGAAAADAVGLDVAQPGHEVPTSAESFLEPPDFARLQMPGPGDDLAEIPASLAPDAVVPSPPGHPGTIYAERTAGLPEFMDLPKDPAGAGPDGPAGPAGPASAPPAGSSRSVWSRHWRFATAGGAIAAIVVAAVIGLGVYSGSLAVGSPAPDTQPGASGPGPRVTTRTGDTPRPSTGTRPTASTGGTPGGAGPGGSPSPSHSVAPSQGTSATPTTSPTHPAGGGHGSKSPSPGNGLGQAPAGYQWHTVKAATLGTTAGFAIAAPDGWQLTITGKTADLAQPGGHGRIAISLHPWTYAGAMHEARYLQKIAAGNDPGYQLGAVRPTDFMAATAAVSRFTWLPAARAHRTVVLSELVTLATTAGVQPYQMTLSVGAPYMAVTRPVYEKMLSTFQPLT